MPTLCASCSVTGRAAFWASAGNAVLEPREMANVSAERVARMLNNPVHACLREPDAGHRSHREMTRARPKAALMLQLSSDCAVGDIALWGNPVTAQSIENATDG